jgi:hypothetical protein
MEMAMNQQANIRFMLGVYYTERWYNMDNITYCNTQQDARCEDNF